MYALLGQVHIYIFFNSVCVREFMWEGGCFQHSRRGELWSLFLSQFSNREWLSFKGFSSVTSLMYWHIRFFNFQDVSRNFAQCVGCQKRCQKSLGTGPEPMYLKSLSWPSVLF